MSTNGPAGPPTSGSAPLSEDRYDKLSRLANEHLARATNGITSSGVSSDPTFFPPLEADDTFPPLHQDFTDTIPRGTEQSTEQDTLSLQPDTYRMGLLSKKVGANFDDIVALGRQLVRDGKLVNPYVNSETGKPTQVLRGEHPDDVPARFSVTDTSFQDTVWGEDGGRTPEVTINEGDTSPELDDFLRNLHRTDTPSTRKLWFIDETTRPMLEPLFSETNPSSLERTASQNNPVHNIIPQNITESEPSNNIKEEVPTTVTPTEIPTLVDRVNERPAPRLIKRELVLRGWFNRVKNNVNALFSAQETSKQDTLVKSYENEPVFLDTVSEPYTAPIVPSHTTQSFSSDTLYKDETRPHGVSEDVYNSLNGLPLKKTAGTEIIGTKIESPVVDAEKRARLAEQAYQVAKINQENHLARLEQEKIQEANAEKERAHAESEKAQAKELQEKLANDAYEVAVMNQKKYLTRIAEKNKPQVIEEPVLRGNIFSRGLKQALKSITTSFTKNGALEQNENKKLSDEMLKRQELQAEDNSHFTHHYKKNDHELTTDYVEDTFLKEFSEDVTDNYLIEKANKIEEAREKKAKEAKKNRSITTRLKTLFLSKEAGQAELKQKINSRGMEGVDVIEQHTEANVDPEAYRLEVRAAIDSVLGRITEKTILKRESVRRELGPEGKGLLNMLDRGAQFFDNNVSPKTRIFAGVTLAATGALALYATPAIGTIAVITAAGAGVRVIGASAAYIGIKRTLDKYIKDVDDHNANREEDDEKFNLKVGRTEKKLFALAGAAGAALLGNLAGEYLAPTLGKVLEEYFPQINDTLFSFSRGVVPSVPVVPEVTTGITPQAMPLPEVPVITFAPNPVPEVVLPPVIETITPTISPELLLHTVKPGENLWAILRKTMEASNFEGFNALSDNLKESMIADALSKLPKNPQEYGITSGNINVIAQGATIDISKAFTK